MIVRYFSSASSFSEPYWKLYYKLCKCYLMVYDENCFKSVVNEKNESIFVFVHDVSFCI